MRPSRLAKLRVIDVTTKKICQAPPCCEYIALWTYVWGDKSGQSPQEGLLPVVQDAVIVTEALGYQYLWVDQYCIDQNPNSPHMKSMIKQMDQIYSNAHVTIVASSGKGADDGLPGISVPRYQSRVAIGGIRLIEVYNMGPSIVTLSKWATQGWT